jgi:hypothetical protein
MMPIRRTSLLFPLLVTVAACTEQPVPPQGAATSGSASAVPADAGAAQRLQLILAAEQRRVAAEIGPAERAQDPLRRVRRAREGRKQQRGALERGSGQPRSRSGGGGIPLQSRPTALPPCSRMRRSTSGSGGLVRIGSKHEEEAFELALPDVEASYDDAARALSGPGVEALAALRAWTAAAPAVPIEVPRWLAAQPWEVLFAIASSGWTTPGRRDRRDVAALLRARAPLYRLQRAKHGERPPWSGRVTVLESSFAQLTRAGFWSRPSPIVVDAQEKPPERFATDVLHLLGAPAPRRRGILLRVRAPSGDHLLDPEPWLRGAAVVVLQLDPIEGYERTATDRREMALLRELAAEAISSGPAHVVLLPALPERLAAKATQILERCVARPVAPTASDLLATLRSIRGNICLAGKVESHMQERAELALDVYLYTTAEADRAAPATGDEP